MPRAKPKSVHAVSFPTSPSIAWTRKAQEALTDDLDLDLTNPQHARRCERMLEALTAELENYKAWEEHRKNYPSSASRLKEFEKTIPVLKDAFEQLGLLSAGALSDMKNAARFWKDEATPRHLNVNIGPDKPVEKHDYIDVRSVNMRVQSGLMDLIVRMKGARAKLAEEERRGRKPSMLPGLIPRLTTIFDKFYRGGTRRRQEALKSFLKDACHHSKIPLPSRFDPLLQK